uniref:Uncharacterized protein n=2 Tax=Anopheles funestus TaxID=62324 RepID=A0A182RQI5_ANOFN
MVQQIRVSFSFIIVLCIGQCLRTAQLISLADTKNATRPFSLHIKRLVCIDAPYTESTLQECRAILRRNQTSLLRVMVVVPKVYNYAMLQFRLHYKYTTYQPFLIDGTVEACSYLRKPNHDPTVNYVHNVMIEMLPSLLYPCPHGVITENTTYNITTVFKEEYAPKSVPAGEYRMDIRFSSKANVTLLSLQTFAAVRRKGILGSMCTEVLLIITIFLIKWQNSHGEVIANEADLKNFTRPFTIRVTRLLCINMPYEETVVKECRAILRRNQRSLICVTIDLPKVYNYIMLQFRLYYKFTSFKPLLIDGQVEVCSYLRNPKRDPLNTYMYEVLKKLMPNTVHPCPHGVSVGVVEMNLRLQLCLHDFQNKTYAERSEFKEEYAPKSVPAGDYRMDLRFASESNVTLQWNQLFFTVRRKGVLGSMLEW